MFASQLHTHLTGKAVHTKHYRNGIELPELNRDDHYSPHYQEIRKLHRQIHVLPVGIQAILFIICYNDKYILVQSHAHRKRISGYEYEAACYT